jgi:hypothetical protein
LGAGGGAALAISFVYYRGERMSVPPRSRAQGQASNADGEAGSGKQQAEGD